MQGPPSDDEKPAFLWLGLSARLWLWWDPFDIATEAAIYAQLQGLKF